MPDLINKQILIVEDDDMSFIYLNQIMGLTNSIISREVSGIGAIELYRSEKRFDMVLMDIQLPDMDGKLVTRKLREMDPIVPIIAQTASKSEQERDEALEAGCSDLITKPFSMEMLFEVIEKHLPHQ